MEDPNRDCQWNDILRERGIIPEREATKAELARMDMDVTLEKVCNYDNLYVYECKCACTQKKH